MGQDYSYTQPSSSDEYSRGLTLLLEEEAALYADEAESNYNFPQLVQDPHHADVEDGIPSRCYCGSVPVIDTSYTRKDPGRRYYSCENADNGDCHVWKWWDVAVTEELSDYETQLRVVKNQGKESEQKIAKLEDTVGGLVRLEDTVAGLVRLEETVSGLVKLEDTVSELAKVEKTVHELAKKKSGVRKGFQLVVCVMVSVLVISCIVY